MLNDKGTPASFFVGGPNAGFKVLGFAGALKTLPTAAVMLQQGIGDQLDEQAKGNHPFIRSTTMALEDLFEKLALADIIEQPQYALR